MDDNIYVTIMIERVVDIVDGNRVYDPTAPYAKPMFYAHLQSLSGDIPGECEIRLSDHGEEWIRITPRQLDEDGDLYFPVEALETAIDKIRSRTEANERAQAERVGAKLDIEGEAEEG